MLAGMHGGRVEQIFVAAEHGDLPKPVGSVRAVAHKGLEGNRYWDTGRAGEELTLIEAEQLEYALEEHRLAIDPAITGRNVLTRGVSLNDLVGKRFRVGEIECRGVQLCEPCKTLEARTQPGAIKALAHRAGLNAEILTDGELHAGDAILPQ